MSMIGAYEMEQRNKARALKQKFYPSVPKPIFKPSQIQELPKFLHLTPRWKKERLHFDEHVMEWRREVNDVNLSPIKAYIRRRAGQLGYTFDQITSRNRKRAISHARFLIWWEIKNYVKPDASYPEIAKISGGFDHSSVIHGVKAIDKWKREIIERNE